MPITTSYKNLDIVLVPFPFTSLSIVRQRPAVIIETVQTQSMGTFYICSMVTSQIQGETIRGDFLVKDWKGAGLLHPSKIRIAKLVTLQEAVIIRRLGHLSVKDQTALATKFRSVFGSLINPNPAIMSRDAGK